MWVGLSVLLFVCQLDLFVVKKSLSKLFFSNHIRTLIANLSVSVRILFGQVDDTAFYESKGSIWGQKTVLSKLSLLHLSFAYLEGKSQGFFQKTVSRFVKTANHVSKMILWRSFFWKSSFFISSFGFERAFLVLCTNFCGSGCQYCFLFVNSASLWWKIFWQSFFLPSFWTLIANLSVFVQFFFNQVDDTVFYESERSLWRQTIVLTNILSLFSSFSNSERKKKIFLVGNQLPGLSNLLTISQGDLLKSFFFEKVLFLLFIDTWAIFFLAFRQNFLCGVVKTALCLSIATVCGKKIFCQNWFSLIIFGHSETICRFFFRKLYGQLDRIAF